jgi:hypothetical protein
VTDPAPLTCTVRCPDGTGVYVRPSQYDRFGMRRDSEEFVRVSIGSPVRLTLHIDAARALLAALAEAVGTDRPAWLHVDRS